MVLDALFHNGGIEEKDGDDFNRLMGLCGGWVVVVFYKVLLDFGRHSSVLY